MISYHYKITKNIKFLNNDFRYQHNNNNDNKLILNNIHKYRDTERI